MKITNDNAQLVALAELLRSKLHERLFSYESGDPKHNAQRNLAGRTHYVDEETLRWHKSRVCSTSHLAAGLLFSITTSDALDMHNTKRGFRTVVFDLFGETVYRPDLEHASKTSAQAMKERDKVEFDVVAHYKARLVDKAARLLNDHKDTLAALALI